MSRQQWNMGLREGKVDSVPSEAIGMGVVFNVGDGIQTKLF